MPWLLYLFAPAALFGFQPITPLPGSFGLQSSAPPAFEVASVRRRRLPPGVFLQRPWSPSIQCPGDLRCGVFGSTFYDEGASLRDLVVDAYAVQTFRIVGLPSWGGPGGDLYDIQAKAAGDSVATIAQVRPMLQTLLADRFRLRIHHETRDLPVYALVPGKHGSKLVPRQVAEACAPSGKTLPPRTVTAPQGNHPEAFRHSWAKETELLTAYADRPVIDNSGLDGPAYCTINGQDPMTAIDLALYGSGADSRTSDTLTIRASISSLIKEIWGMKLEPRNAPLDVLVIDHVERSSEN